MFIEGGHVLSHRLGVEGKVWETILYKQTYARGYSAHSNTYRPAIPKVRSAEQSQGFQKIYMI